MYALNLRKPQVPVRQAAPARSQPRHVRDDLAVPDMIDPSLMPITDDESTVEDSIVQSVTPVAPQMKKFRATICRTVTQCAIVEYEALETQAGYSVAEELAEKVPADAWTTDPANSWCYIDKLEDLGPAATSSVIETAADDTLEEAPDYPAVDNADDETGAPAAAGRSRRARRALAKRAMPDEIITQAQDILDQASTAASTLGMEGTDPQSVVDTLQQLLQQIQGLQDNVDGDMSGADADIDSQVAAVQFVNDAAQQIEEMMEEAQADVVSAENEAAAA